MTWFKVDDRLHGHRKARIAGPAAMGLWVLAGSWAADQLTDGFVPRSQVHAFAENALELVERLVSVELWLPTVQLGEDGWLFHDWTDFQPTKADVMARREFEREKKRKKRSCPPGTTPGNPPGSPGTGSSSDSKENPYPDSPGLSPGDTSKWAHAFVGAAHGECADCGLPAGNRRHIRIVEAS
jgi:hypothetical protein